MRRSQLLLIDVATGSQRPLTSRITVLDAAQPAWSPHGDRIAFWGTDEQGNSIIYTIDAKMPNALPVAAVSGQHRVAFNPFWAASGNALYYASLIQGAQNLWRVAINEHSGAVTGEPRAVPLPTASASFFALSRDGRHLAYVEDRSVWQIHGASFDPQAETLGEVKSLTQGTQPLVRPSVSADGQWITMSSLPPHDDIYVSRLDGSELRQLTSDGVSRAARWIRPGFRAGLAPRIESAIFPATVVRNMCGPWRAAAAYRKPLARRSSGWAARRGRRTLRSFVSPDDRRIYFGMKRDDADVWMASLADAL